MAEFFLHSNNGLWKPAQTGRTSAMQTGQKAAAVQPEKNYYKNVPSYYRYIRKPGLEYESLDYSKSLDFLLMTANGIKTKG
ncbi:MAG: hypothetical protein ABR572_11240 [Cryomorphaceae bacterium]